MPYLIDGHNLIPNIPGLDLSQLDDEDRLVTLLQEFARVRSVGVEVFFDQAPPTRGGKKKAGRVVIHNVRSGKTADRAIVERLDQLGKQARNWTVVSSDRQVRQEAIAHKAITMSSENFSRQLLVSRAEGSAAQPEESQPDHADEVDFWLDQFRKPKS